MFVEDQLDQSVRTIFHVEEILNFNFATALKKPFLKTVLY